MHYCLMIKTTGTAIRRKKLLMVPITWMNPKGIIMNEKKSLRRLTYYMIPLM